METRSLRAARVLVALLLSFGWFLLVLLLFNFAQLWMPIAAPLGTTLLVFIALQLLEQQEKQQIMSLFGKLLAPETAKLIWQRKEEIFQSGELQAQEMVATVLFMDIRGFTTISENLSPSQLLGWLNRYLEGMSNCIMVGDTVNVAARLEAMNKEVKEDNPYHLLVTSETYEYVRDYYRAKSVKSIQLRGREKETVICSILGKK